MLFDLRVGRGSESGMEASRAGVVEPELGFLWALKYLKQDKVFCFVDLLELKCPGWTLWSSGPGSLLCPLPFAHCPHPLVGHQPPPRDHKHLAQSSFVGFYIKGTLLERVGREMSH